MQNESKQEQEQEQAQDYRPIILASLQTLKKREIANKEPFKARAYQTIIQQLEQRTDPIYAMEDMESFKGMGTKIREKVQEILETGQLRAAEVATERYHLNAHDELQAVYGIGPAKATELIRQGIHTVAELRRRIGEDRSLLNDKQLIGLRYYEDLLQRIPRQEMAEHESFLVSFTPMPAELVGSYRRGTDTSGDIDVLLRAPKGTTPADTKDAFYAFVRRLENEGYIREILALGPHKCMAICQFADKPARRLDLLVTPDEEYACALLYFTGSDRFNVAFRQHALTKGYTLNEHALTPLTPEARPVPYFPSEVHIFRFLGLHYTSPDQRKDVSSVTQMRVQRPKRG